MDRVTVTQLAEAADINRKTFYAHYREVGEVLEDVEDEVVGVFRRGLRGFDFEDEPTPTSVFVELGEAVKADEETYRLLFRSDYSGIVNKLAQEFSEAITTHFSGGAPTDEAKVRTAATYCVHGMMAVFDAWFRSTSSEPLDVLGRRIDLLVMAGLSGFLPKGAPGASR